MQKPLLHIYPHKDSKGGKHKWPVLVEKIGELLELVGNDEFKAKVHSHRAMPSHRIARACISRKSQLPARTRRASDARASHTRTHKHSSSLFHVLSKPQVSLFAYTYTYMYQNPPN